LILSGGFGHASFHSIAAASTAYTIFISLRYIKVPLPSFTRVCILIAVVLKILYKKNIGNRKPDFSQT
jgi:hypothetical protein